MNPKQICPAIALLIAGLAASPAFAELIAYFPFEEGQGTTTVDATGNGHEGTLNADVAWVPGYQGGGVQFDTAGERIVIGPIDPSHGSNAMTLAAWINWEGQGHSIGQQGIIGKRLGWDPGTGVKWFWQTNPAGDFLFRADSANGGGGGGLGWGNGLLAPYANEWTHVAVTWDNGTTIQYINAEEVSSGNIDFIDTADDTPVSIGCVDSTNNETFVGIIDEARIYNQALSSEELIKAMTGDVTSAFAPNPADGSADVPRDTMLTWEAGELAASHNVYIGLTREDVAAADGVAPPGGAAAMGLNVTEYDLDEVLRFDTAYYWRVDEVNGAPDNTVFKGSVWTFTAEPYSIQIPESSMTVTASSYTNEFSTPENTINGSGLGLDGTHAISSETMWFTASVDLDPWIQYEFDDLQKLDTMKVWNSNSGAEMAIGWGVKDVEIAYSVDGESWDVLADVNQFSRAPGSPAYNQYDEVAFGGVPARYVRLNIASNWGGLLMSYSLSEVQFTMIPAQARTPMPASGSVDVLPDAVVSWRAGRNASEHTVYFSTDPNKVTDGSAMSLTSSTNTVDLGSLDLQLATTYYWRVDEVNEADATSVWAGPVWSLSTLGTISVDDFERYNNLSPDRPFQTWLDGFGYSADAFYPVSYAGNGTGAGVGHDIWGLSSPYYDGDIMETDNVRGGRQSLPLYYNNTGGVASQIDRNWSTPLDWSGHGIQTLILNFFGDPNNTGTSVYTIINGKKVTYPENADLKAASWHQWPIDLASLGINLNAISSMSIGVDGAGSGMILVDEISLYRTAPSLITAWYSLENNTDDVSGNGHHGTTVGEPVYVTGAEGMGLLFDGTGSQYVDLGTFNPSDGTGQLSVALWAQWQGLSGSYQGLIGKRDTWAAEEMMWQIEANIDSGNVTFARNGSYPGSGNPVLPIGEWAHVGVSFNSTIARFYINGLETGSGDFSMGTDAQAAIQFGACEAGGGNPFNGALDEVKLYNRALSDAEMGELAGL